MQKNLFFTWQIVPLGHMKFPPQGLGSSIIIITPNKKFIHYHFTDLWFPLRKLLYVPSLGHLVNITPLISFRTKIRSFSSKKTTAFRKLKILLNHGFPRPTRSISKYI